MMYIENNTLTDGSREQTHCKVCDGRGSILVYRSDLEEFEEVQCELCKNNS